jgi:hypothetical protein
MRDGDGILSRVDRGNVEPESEGSAVVRDGCGELESDRLAYRQVVGGSARRASRGTPRCSGGLSDVGRVNESAGRPELGSAGGELDAARTALGGASSNERHARRGERAGKSDLRGGREWGETRESRLEARSRLGAPRKSGPEARNEGPQARLLGRATHSFEPKARMSNGEPALVAPKDAVGARCDTHIGICDAQPEPCAGPSEACGTRANRSVSMGAACDAQSEARVLVARPCGVPEETGAVPFEEFASASVLPRV